MTFRTFLLGLAASFGVAWLSVVVVPFLKMRDLQPIVLKEDVDGKDGIYFPKRSGRVANGATVYAQNGCYLCHTQVVRPTYAGNDLFRADWGGLKDAGDRGDTRRETNAFDFQGEKFAQIGVTRQGPDLSNLGLRVENAYAKNVSPEAWLYAHLYNPRADVTRSKSNCPPYRFLFEEKKVLGNRSREALPFESPAGTEIVPSAEARALVSYLLSLKKDDAPPASLNFAPVKKK
ncbi:MAG TPA: cbb3-type cytochrome c oxidase subunit II [Rariglobus sp.]